MDSTLNSTLNSTDVRPLIARPDSTLTRATRFARSPVFHLLNSDCLFGAHRPPPIDDAIDATKAFFALPTSEKRRFERSKDRAAGFSDCELTVPSAPRRSANFSPSLITTPISRAETNSRHQRSARWVFEVDQRAVAHALAHSLPRSSRHRVGPQARAPPRSRAQCRH